MHQRPHIAVDPRLRVFADGARVDDDAVRALFRVGELIAAALQHAADALRVSLVLLTAVGVDEGQWGASLRQPVFPNLFTDSFLPLQIALRDHDCFALQGSFLRILIT